MKSTIRRVDLCILPLLGSLYAVCVMDRGNLGLARVAGMDRDLGLNTGSRYSIIVCLFFVPYILFQLPSTIFLRHIGVGTWLSFCVISWGAVQLGMGFVKSWGTLLLCRMLLGALEAGFLPGIVFVISTWYTRHELQQRLAIFYVFSVVLGGFGEILAYAFTLLGGRHGIEGWRWIFIVEGSLTIGLGAMSWMFIPEFPDRNRFLNMEQTDLVLVRVEKDRGDSVPDDFTVPKILAHLSDWKLWVFGLMFFCASVPAYAVNFFVTNILLGMGWSMTAALLLGAPPPLFAAISMVIFARLSDRYRRRALTIAIQTIITIAGLLLIGFSPRSALRYVGVFLASAGSGGCIPGILAYSSNNVVSHTKRGVTSAIVVSFGGLGGLFATAVYRQADAPYYMAGIYVTLACQALLLILLGVTTIHFMERNRQAQQCPRAIPIEGKVGFWYTL